MLPLMAAVAPVKMPVPSRSSMFLELFESNDRATGEQKGQEKVAVMLSTWGVISRNGFRNAISDAEYGGTDGLFPAGEING